MYQVLHQLNALMGGALEKAHANLKCLLDAEAIILMRTHGNDRQPLEWRPSLCCHPNLVEPDKDTQHMLDRARTIVDGDVFGDQPVHRLHKKLDPLHKAMRKVVDRWAAHRPQGVLGLLDCEQLPRAQETARNYQKFLHIARQLGDGGLLISNLRCLNSVLLGFRVDCDNHRDAVPSPDGVFEDPDVRELGPEDTDAVVRMFHTAHDASPIFAQVREYLTRPHRVERELFHKQVRTELHEFTEHFEGKPPFYRVRYSMAEPEPHALSKRLVNPFTSAREQAVLAHGNGDLRSTREQASLDYGNGDPREVRRRSRSRSRSPSRSRAPSLSVSPSYSPDSPVYSASSQRGSPSYSAPSRMGSPVRSQSYSPTRYSPSPARGAPDTQQVNVMKQTTSTFDEPPSASSSQGRQQGSSSAAVGISPDSFAQDGFMTSAATGKRPMRDATDGAGSPDASRPRPSGEQAITLGLHRDPKYVAQLAEELMGRAPLQPPPPSPPTSPPESVVDDAEGPSSISPPGSELDASEEWPPEVNETRIIVRIPAATGTPQQNASAAPGTGRTVAGDIQPWVLYTDASPLNTAFTLYAGPLSVTIWAHSPLATYSSNHPADALSRTVTPDSGASTSVYQDASVQFPFPIFDMLGAFQQVPLRTTVEYLSLLVGPSGTTTQADTEAQGRQIIHSSDDQESRQISLREAWGLHLGYQQQSLHEAWELHLRNQRQAAVSDLVHGVPAWFGADLQRTHSVLPNDRYQLTDMGNRHIYNVVHVSRGFPPRAPFAIQEREPVLTKPDTVQVRVVATLDDSTDELEVRVRIDALSLHRRLWRWLAAEQLVPTQPKEVPAFTPTDVAAYNLENVYLRNPMQGRHAQWWQQLRTRVPCLGWLRLGCAAQYLAAMHIQKCFRRFIYNAELRILVYVLEMRWVSMQELRGHYEFWREPFRGLEYMSTQDHMQGFGYMRAKLHDVFVLMIEPMQLGHRATHFLRAPEGNAVLDLGLTLQQVNGMLSIPDVAFDPYLTLTLCEIRIPLWRPLARPRDIVDYTRSRQPLSQPAAPSPKCFILQHVLNTCLRTDRKLHQRVYKHFTTRRRPVQNRQVLTQGILVDRRFLTTHWVSYPDQAIVYTLEEIAIPQWYQLQFQVTLPIHLQRIDTSLLVVGATELTDSLSIYPDNGTFDMNFRVAPQIVLRCGWTIDIRAMNVGSRPLTILPGTPIAVVTVAPIWEDDWPIDVD